MIHAKQFSRFLPNSFWTVNHHLFLRQTAISRHACYPISFPNRTFFWLNPCAQQKGRVDMNTWGQSMIKRYFKKLLLKNKDFILSQVLAVKGLMQLLMKNRNTGEKWTKEEIKEIKSHLRHISKMVPVIIVFLLPGGSLMLPFLAEVLDRRKTIRRKL